ELINAVKTDYLESHKYTGVDFEKICEKIEQKSADGASLNSKIDFAFGWVKPGNAESQELCNLTIQVSHDKNIFRVAVVYNESVYDSLIIDQFADSLGVFFENVKNNLNRPVSVISVLGISYQNKIVEGFNSTQAPYGVENTLISIFEKQVEQTPHHI